MARVLVPGGAGFVGANLAAHLARGGFRVVVIDDLRRSGSERNAAWLAGAHGARLDVVVASLHDQRLLDAAIAGCDAVVHLAAQVAVTTSLQDPIEDFEANSPGTLRVLESGRLRAPA